MEKKHMKFSSRLWVMVVTAVLAAAAPADAHAQQADLIADLLAKGKEAYNNFNYRGADSVARQLLGMQLSRQQRIDVLELRAAAMFPDEAAEQKPDEAVKVIRELVELGVSRMTTAELTWRGCSARER
jgi:cytosine/adenosine deaminase-related metal-dependent hydrolase